jgi:hypothetical protein
MIEFDRDFTHSSRGSVRANDDLSVLMTSPSGSPLEMFLPSAAAALQFVCGGSATAVASRTQRGAEQFPKQPAPLVAQVGEVAGPDRPALK